MRSLSLVLCFVVLIAVFSVVLQPIKGKALVTKGYWVLSGEPTKMLLDTRVAPYIDDITKVENYDATITKDTYSFHILSLKSYDRTFNANSKTSQTDATYHYTPFPEKMEQGEVFNIKVDGQQTGTNAYSSFKMRSENVYTGTMGKEDVSAARFSANNDISIEGENKKSETITFTAPEVIRSSHEFYFNKITFTIITNSLNYIYTYTFKESQESHTITLLRGTASIFKVNGDSWTPLEVGKSVDIVINDKIKTGENTRAEMKFPDGSIFKMKSNTIAALLKAGIQLQVGESWFNIQKQGSTFQVVTPTTVCGVLGTTFSVSVAANGDTETMLYTGTLQIGDKDNNNKLTINGGEKLKATAKGLNAPQKLSTYETSENWSNNDTAAEQSTTTNTAKQIPWLLIIIIVVLAVLILAAFILFVKKKH